MRWCIGHRGSPAFEPENTRSSFERALARDGANALEIDVCMTKDSGLVLWHDWSPHGVEALCRESGLEPDVAFRPLPPQVGRLRRRLSELYLEDVVRHFGYALRDGPRERIASARVMTFAELLSFAAGQRRLRALFIDVKIPNDEIAAVPAFMARAGELLAERPLSCEVVFETGSPKVLDAMKACAPERSFTLDAGPLLGLHRIRTYSSVARAIHHTNALATLERPRQWCVRPWETYRRIAAYDLRLLRRHNARCAPEERVRGVIGYTVNVPDEMRHLLAIGMIGLQTNRPDVLSSVMEEQEPGGEALPFEGPSIAA